MRSDTLERKWDPKDVENLRVLAASGMSAEDMANKLGISKNAIIGKCYRAGIQIRVKPQAERRVRQSKKPVKDAAKKKVFSYRPLPDAPKNKPLPEDTVIRKTTVPFPPEFGCCVFVIGDPKALRCCGLKSHKGYVYCRQHCQAVYQPERPRHV